jgi:hypothetical protein
MRIILPAPGVADEVKVMVSGEEFQGLEDSDLPAGVQRIGKELSQEKNPLPLHNEIVTFLGN